MKGLHRLKEDFVCRALRTDEDPYKGIECKKSDSNRTIDEHVRKGLTHPSKYISTTASFELAQRWIRTSEFMSVYRRGTTIVKIDVNYLRRNYHDLVNSAYNFSDEDVRNTFLTGRSKEFASTYEEVVFEEYIPVGAICDIHVEGKGWIGTERPLGPIPIPTSIYSPSFLAMFSSTTPTIVSSTIEKDDDTSSPSASVVDDAPTEELIIPAEASDLTPSTSVVDDTLTEELINPAEASDLTPSTSEVDDTPTEELIIPVEASDLTPSAPEVVPPEDTFPVEAPGVTTVSNNEG